MRNTDTIRLLPSAADSYDSTMVITESTDAPSAAQPTQNTREIRVVELFAGVGGFRKGLQDANQCFKIIWSNQWEPSTKAQHASKIYVDKFGPEGHSNEDINAVLNQIETGERPPLPEHDLLVGGFPCQDYSVARTRAQATGLKGKKGVLWWEIERILNVYRPRMFFLENVDRLLKSPTTPRQPGRDFALMLASVRDLGYDVEWRVVNAADYGFPQKRRRVFIVGYHRDSVPTSIADKPLEWLLNDGPIARALPVDAPLTLKEEPTFKLTGTLEEITESFNVGGKTSPFLNSGLLVGNQIWTHKVTPDYQGEKDTLSSVLEDAELVPPEFWVSDEEELGKWRYLKGAKHATRVSKKTGVAYTYDEGPIPFPDDTDGPSRTIVTGEGGATPSRFKHIIKQNGRYRRLTPRELEQLNGFDPGHTEGVPDGRRAFLMGNALVVGVVESIGRELAEL